MPTTGIDAQLYSFKVVNQMIQYKDFAPRITERGPFGGASEYESFSEVVSAVNQWIESTTIQVINVETVVLPIASKAQVMVTTD